MMRIIVNADDFGINEIVTSEIERMILSGNISSTTIMANGQCLKEVKKFAIDHPKVSYGMHLCLSEFDSLTHSEILNQAGLTDEKGRFITNAIFSFKNYDNSEIRKAIVAELNAQIEILKGLGIPISHVDSHHHVHAMRGLSDIFVEVLQKQGVNKIRRAPDFHTLRAKLHLREWHRLNTLNKCFKSVFVTTDVFYSYSVFVKNGQQHKDGKIVELMCHPGHPDSFYKNEMQLVEKNVVGNNPKVRLISYNEIN